jgi:hypothetical protein
VGMLFSLYYTSTVNLYSYLTSRRLQRLRQLLLPSKYESLT